MIVAYSRKSPLRFKDSEKIASNGAPYFMISRKLTLVASNMMYFIISYFCLKFLL